jgi:hypothetical protein
MIQAIRVMVLGILWTATLAHAAEVRLGGVGGPSQTWGNADPAGLNTSGSLSFNTTTGVTASGLVRWHSESRADGGRDLRLELGTFRVESSAGPSRTVFFTLTVIQNFVVEPGWTSGSSVAAWNGSINTSSSQQSGSVTYRAVHGGSDLPVLSATRTFPNAPGFAGSVSSAAPVPTTGVYRLEHNYIVTMAPRGTFMSLTIEPSTLVTTLIPSPSAFVALCLGLGTLRRRR